MDWEKWYYIFNIFAPIITMIGIIISFWVSLKTLKEVREEKILAQKPYLIFKQGGFRDKAILVKEGRTLPGFSLEAIQIAKKDMPEDTISIGRKFIKKGKLRLFGVLQNYGNGTAFNINLTWIPKIIWINEEKFIIDENKNQEVKYSKMYNTHKVGEFNLLPQQITGILHWPTFIEMDCTLSITRVEGYFKINYDDSFGNHYSTYQGYHLFTNYEDEIPSIHVTFIETFNSEKDWRFEE